MSETFPQWGFWTQRDSKYGSINMTSKVHLFLSETTTACGYSPIVQNWQSFMRRKFSNEPKIGIWEIAFQMKFGRKSTIDDFNKCKKCLKKESKT